jgi:spore maturation protein CgeB
MIILYVALKYDYGKPEQGYSFEHYNFYNSLHNMGHDILYFDFTTLMRERGQKAMNQRLKEVAQAEKPDLMFTVLFTDELDPAVVRAISEGGDTVTLNWFCDDHWRFENFSRHWAPCFNWVVTTAQSALSKYSRLGYTSVIKSQWACNHFLYRKLNLTPEYDVSFVGQPHGNRRQIIQALRQAGVKVCAWGNGWESGRVSQDQMIRIFNQSRINLNLSNASSAGGSVFPGGQGARRRLSQLLDRLPFGQQFKQGWRRLRALHSSQLVYSDQIKGRNFEIPGCGGFMLTGRADNLEDYYAIGREIVCFDSMPELIDKVRYYLAHPDERLAVAEVGYQRTLSEHTYAHRFTKIFQQLKLPGPSSGKSEDVH